MASQAFTTCVGGSASRPPAKRISVGEVISETSSIYGQNLGALLGSAIVVFIVVGLIAGILEASGGLILILLAAAVRFAAMAKPRRGSPRSSPEP